MNVPIWIIIGFQQSDKKDSQTDSFGRLPVTSIKCIIGTEKYPDAGKLVNYDDDD